MDQATIDPPRPAPAPGSDPAAEPPGRPPRRGRGLLGILSIVLVAFAAGVAGSIFASDVREWLGLEAQGGSTAGPRVAADAGEGVRGAPMSNDPDSLTVQEIYDMAAPAVVNIEARQTTITDSIFGFPQERRGVASGSGFVIDDAGNIVTNAHVVRDSSAISVTFSDDRQVEASLVGLDISSDIAVIRVDVDAEGLVPLEFADSGAVTVGDPVVAIGNPFGLDRTATSGIVSALQREIRAENGFSIPDVIQTDAAINSGNSGGPLLDARGRVIGVNSQIQTPSGGNVGIAFSIPSNTVRSVVEDILEDGVVSRAWLGVTGVSIDDIVLGYLRLPVEEGVLVSEVVPGSPAAEAGLRGAETFANRAGSEYPLDGDIIVSYDGTEVTSMRQLVDLVAQSRPGDSVEVVYYRGDERDSVTIDLVERPNTAAGQQPR